MGEFSQEWLCARLVADSRDAVIFADPEGVIRLWNTGAAELFGYQPFEALGRPLDLIIPENLRERHNLGIGRLWPAAPANIPRNSWRSRAWPRTAAASPWNLPLP